MMVQHQYDDELIKLSYMDKVSQELTVILPILPLLLEDRLGIYSSYTIGTEEYQWDSTLEKVISIEEDNYLEKINRNWIQHTDDFSICNTNYKDEDHGGYAINIVSFDIV